MLQIVASLTIVIYDCNSFIIQATGVFVQGILREKYYCTIDLLFDWFGISFLLLFAKQTNPNQSNKRSMVQ